MFQYETKIHKVINHIGDCGGRIQLLTNQGPEHLYKTFENIFTERNQKKLVDGQIGIINSNFQFFLNALIFCNFWVLSRCGH